MESPKLFAIERFLCTSIEGIYLSSPHWRRGSFYLLVGIHIKTVCITDNKIFSDLNSLDCLFIFITVKRKVGKDSSSDATGPPRNPKYSQVLLPFSNSVPIIRNKISQIGYCVLLKVS